MNITIHRGFNQIGGNIIEISKGSTHILLDAGEELPGQTQEGTPIDFRKLLAAQRYDAIFISHYHGDHIGLLESIDDLPPVIMGELAYRLYKTARAYRGETCTFSFYRYLRDRLPISIDSLEIIPYLADHSAADAYSLKVSDGDATVFYTGDFRGNGRKSFHRYLESLPTKVDAIITEGTTLSRPDYRNLSESELEEKMAEVMTSCPNQVFVLMSAMNIDRVVSVFKAARRSHRCFLMDPYMAMITVQCKDIHIPNPEWKEVKVYLPSGVPKDEHAKYKQMFGSKLISRNAIRTKVGKYVMAVRASEEMLHNLKMLDGSSSSQPGTTDFHRATVPQSSDHNLKGSVLIYSLWEGYRQQDPTRRFLDEVASMGIDIVSLHASGHADETELNAVIQRVNPTYIIPVHTENTQWFADHYPDRRIYTERALTIEKRCLK